MLSSKLWKVRMGGLRVGLHVVSNSFFLGKLETLRRLGSCDLVVVLRFRVVGLCFAMIPTLFVVVERDAHYLRIVHKLDQLRGTELRLQDNRVLLRKRDN